MEMHRRLGVLNTTSINMSNMIGTGPFITVAGADGILAAMQGPQALIGWLLGAVIALADGLVVAELGAAFPQSGGPYVFLREGFGRWGRLMSFLFVWQFLFSGPLEIASGNIGIVQYLGYFIPGLVLDHRISRYRLRIENGLPDALDLLIVSLEAGLALDQAILKCAEEFTIAHPELAEELRLINVECRAGKPRLEAFKNFAARTNVDDVRSLVAMLVQTDRFGTSVAQALRTHAEVSRTKRRQRAEERAAKIGVKLVFPLVFCLFPAFYVVTLGPAIIKFIKAFGSGGFATGG